MYIDARNQIKPSTFSLNFGQICKRERSLSKFFLSYLTGYFRSDFHLKNIKTKFVKSKLISHIDPKLH